MASLDYYSTTAQVLPVIALAILIETGAEDLDGFDVMAIAAALCFLIAGEAAALHVLSTRKATDSAHALIDGAYILGGAGILYGVIESRFAIIRRQHPRLGRLAGLLWFALVLFMIARAAT